MLSSGSSKAKEADKTASFGKICEKAPISWLLLPYLPASINDVLG
jgi:hypothetical protein